MPFDLTDFILSRFNKAPGFYGTPTLDFSPGVEAQAAAYAADRELARAHAEQAQPEESQPKLGAKRKLTPEEKALQDLLNTPRGETYGR